MVDSFNIINNLVIGDLTFKNHARSAWEVEQSLTPVKQELIKRDCNAFIADTIIKSLSYACILSGVQNKPDQLKSTLVTILQNGALDNVELKEFLQLLPLYKDYLSSETIGGTITLSPFLLSIYKSKDELEEKFKQMC